MDESVCNHTDVWRTRTNYNEMRASSHSTLLRYMLCAHVPKTDFVSVSNARHKAMEAAQPSRMHDTYCRASKTEAQRHGKPAEGSSKPCIAREASGSCTGSSCSRWLACSLGRGLIYRNVYFKLTTTVTEGSKRPSDSTDSMRQNRSKG